ncbi:MAG TPA: hypothetical protein DCE41_25500 [Cytophagales bacterium]|nr:hypothetical protein [Cytophagales bacterium]HAA20828.1 hypothetical protein [Cytophagales bacterium]HAP59117.1 hypothetical protein [Cytophagales bacterium]
MRKLLVLSLTLLSIHSLFAQGQPIVLSNQAKISLLTVDQWDVMWAAFGHSGVRVFDPLTGVDKAYDYGVFDFSSPTFYQDFSKGLMNYMVVARNYRSFTRRYEQQGRWVHEQVFDLDSADTQALFDYFENNAKPENASYLYHYFYNNCATRVLDIFEEVLGDRIKFKSDHLTEEHTLRSLVHDYTYMAPFGKFGIDLVLGSNIDKPATPKEIAFLPDYTKLAFDNAEYQSATGWKPIVLAETIPVDLPSLREKTKNPVITPALILWLLFIVGLFLTLRHQKMPVVGRVFDTLIFFIFGAGGTLMLFMWFGTDHVDARNNFNLLWAWPTHLVLAFFLISTKWTAKVQRYFRVVAIFLVLVVLLWWAWPQDLPNAAIPLVLLGAIRAARAGFVN